MLVFGLCTTVLLTPLAELKAMPIWRLFKNVEVKLTLAVLSQNSHLQIEATPLSIWEEEVTTIEAASSAYSNTSQSSSSVNTLLLSKFSSVITAIKSSVDHMKPTDYGIVKSSFKSLSSISS